MSEDRRCDNTPGEAKKEENNNNPPTPEVVVEEEADEAIDWDMEPRAPPLTKDKKLELVLAAMERTQRCATMDDFAKKYLEHDFRAYRRIVRLLVDTNPQTGAAFVFFSLRTYSIEELDRLKRAGLNVENDDFVFRDGNPSTVLQIEPHDSKISKKERVKINNFLARYAEASRVREELEKAKRNQPAIMNSKTGDVIVKENAPPGALALPPSQQTAKQ